MFNGEIIFYLEDMGLKSTCGLSGFYRHEHIYIYRRQEFQNIIECKLCSCFGQLLLIYWNVKNVDHGIGHSILIVLIELSYIRHSCRLYSRLDEYLKI